MEQFYLERPSLDRKDEIIEYINEFVSYNSDINGTGSLDKILEGYTFEQALERCLNMQNEEFAKSLNRCQSKTFLLIRKNDNKIVGTINVRWNLTEAMKVFGGNIGYGIRPTERRKGYNKINLYLGLIEAKKLGLDKVMLDCDVSNLGSSKTMEALGGVLERTEIDPYDGIMTSVYWFNVDECLEKYKSIYKKHIYDMRFNIRKSVRDDSSKIAHVVTIAWNETYKGIVSDDILNNMYKTEKERAQRAYDNYVEEENNQYILEVNDEVVGFINIGESSIDGFDGYGELYALYVMGKYKGYGFGRMLVDKAKEELKKMGYNKMVIGCLDKNPTNEFYKHMGGKYVKTHIFEKLNLDENLYIFDI